MSLMALAKFKTSMFLFGTTLKIKIKISIILLYIDHRYV